MATKTGFQYYSVETDRYQDKKIRRLKNECGCNGLAVYDFILCEIYRVKGCFLEWDESTAFDVADYFGLKENQVKEIVNYCCAVGLFSKELLTNERILTSSSIQSRFIDWSKKAKRAAPIIPEKILLIPEVGPKITEQQHNILEEIKQSKVKKSKVEESKEKARPLYSGNIPPTLKTGNPAPQAGGAAPDLPIRYMVPLMLEAWLNRLPDYPQDSEKDNQALGGLSRFIAKVKKEPYEPDNGECVDKILASWSKVAEFVSKDDFYKSFSLQQVERHIQNILQRMKNGSRKKSKENPEPGGVAVPNGQRTYGEL